jgi:glucose-6-phosphate dehydrogenase assembly protein OpcA
MRVALEAVEREVARLWEEEARRSQAPRIELQTIVALVSEPRLLERARRVMNAVTAVHPSRSIVAVWTDGAEATITADVALHRGAAGDACGDAIGIEAVGAAREWLPENVDRLALSDLPVCLWWVGDLPDFDDLFDRMVVSADQVIVNSGEMDLRDLEKLASIAARSRGRYALADLTWIRLRTLQELVARFFDDEAACARLRGLERVTLQFSPRENEADVASTQAGLFFGWIAHALSLDPEGVRWTRGATWGEARLAGGVVARFEHVPRAGVWPGAVTRVEIVCGDARFEVTRGADDPRVFVWTRELPGSPMPAHTLRVGPFDEAALLARCLERPKRDRLLEASLHAGSRIVRPVAPRLSAPPRGK